MPRGMQRKIFAPAKINVVLRVVGRRPNGYHDLLMLNEKLSVGDDIIIDVAVSAGQEPKIKITSDDPSVPCDETNLCYKAAMAILSSRVQPGDPRLRGDDMPSGNDINIHIVKRTPVAAGLGGGSSDAAATLKGLNDLLELGLPVTKLAEIGVRLGADVPFFLHDGPAICEGIGDLVTTLNPLPKAWILLINPGFPVATKHVYDTFDKISDLQLTAKGSRDSLPRFFKGLDEVAKVVHNDLELVTAKEHPEIERIKKLLMSVGALVSWMSGSGPTVVGIFESEKMCSKAADAARKENAGWRVIETSN